MIEQRYTDARAYSDGRLLCTGVILEIRRDPRLGLTARERRTVSARFRHPQEPLRSNLQRLARRRGAFGTRIADALDPITVVVDQDGEHLELTGRLAPPDGCRGAVSDIAFPLSHPNFSLK